ncbi:DNA repair protein XRCC1-like isoform X4 [Acipenser ruthenus]|uniref:DNA repair protein XRCC1-like isoform X4 n=1 Tax=Acipenser ruthenus TaxID=7906 RepID=UPI0027414564|nr:DNA repair protein XRCC1-like isoform X4 [Acipenser ruthenus]
MCEVKHPEEQLLSWVTVFYVCQDPKHSVDTLLAKEAVRPWLCAPKDHSGLMKVELQLERASAIGYIDIGNCGSAFIQIDVGRSSWPQDQPYMTLLPTATLMSPTESRQGTNRTGVRMFKEGDFLSQGDGELWDRVRVTCSQPFNKRVQFGLSFLQIRTPLDQNENEVLSDGTETQVSPGQLGASQAREWLSSPTIQSTFFGQTQGGCSAETVQARLQRVDPSSCVRFRDRVCLSRSARMVISASQSKRRPPACPSTDTASCSEGGHLEGTKQATKQSHTAGLLSPGPLVSPRGRGLCLTREQLHPLLSVGPQNSQLRVMWRPEFLKAVVPFVEIASAWITYLSMPHPVRVMSFQSPLM